MATYTLKSLMFNREKEGGYKNQAWVQEIGSEKVKPLVLNEGCTAA